MRTFTLNLTDFSGFVQPAAQMNADDGDIASYSKVFAKQLGENQPEFLNRGLCVATCDETDHLIRGAHGYNSLRSNRSTGRLDLRSDSLRADNA